MIFNVILLLISTLLLPPISESRKANEMNSFFLRRQLVELGELKNLTEDGNPSEKDNSSAISFVDSSIQSIKSKEEENSSTTDDGSSFRHDIDPSDKYASEIGSTNIEKQKSYQEEVLDEVASVKSSSDKLCEATSCDQCLEKAISILKTDDKYSCSWEIVNDMFKCKVVTKGGNLPICTSEDEIESSGGKMAIFAALIACILLTGVGIKLKKLSRKSSDADSIEKDVEDELSFGRTGLQEMAPLNVSGEEEWGWEDGPSLGDTSNISKEDDDLQMAMALSLSQTTSLKNQESSVTTTTRSNINNTKLKKSTKAKVNREDIFASVGIASKPKFTNSKNNASSINNSSWKDTIDEDSANDNWDDDLDELLN